MLFWSKYRRLIAHQSRYFLLRILICSLTALWVPLAVEGQTSPVAGDATIRGVVRNSSGQPVAGATIQLRAKADARPLSIHSSSDGAFLFNATAGAYTIDIAAPGYNSATIGPFTLASHEAKQLDLRIDPAKTDPKTPSIGPPQFSDEPTFTVAGVTDANAMGGHGSDAVVRTGHALAKETLSLRDSESNEKSASLSSPSAPGARLSADEQQLRQTAEREPQNFAANHQLGKLLLDQGRAPQSLPYLQRAAQLKPDDYENAYALATARVSAADYEPARIAIHGLLAGNDRSKADLGVLHHLLATIAEKTGNPVEAVSEYQRAAELNASEPNFFDWGSELLLHRAPEPAIEVFTQGNRLFPESARMLLGLGVALYSHGSVEEAAQRLGQASDLNPQDAAPYLFLGRLQSADSSRSTLFMAKLERFARLQPENPMANYYYALSLWKLRTDPQDEKLKRAETLLEKAVRLDPALAHAHLQLGLLRAERKDYAAAIQSYQRAVKANPDLEEAHYRLALAYKLNGQLQEAETEARLYQELSKKKEEDSARERHEIQQFVYTLRDGNQPPR